MAADQITGRVFGEPHQTPDGSTIIPVARIGRWRGTVHPVGVFVVHEGAVTWRPAVDETRIELLGALIGLVAATIGTLAVLRRPPWPEVFIRRITR